MSGTRGPNRCVILKGIREFVHPAGSASGQILDAEPGPSAIRRPSTYSPVPVPGGVRIPHRDLGAVVLAIRQFPRRFEDPAAVAPTVCAAVRG